MLSIYLWTLLLIFFTWYFLLFYWRRRHIYNAARNVPGPRGLPIFGNIFSFIGSTTGICNKLLLFCQTYPDVFKFWFGPYLIYGVTKPQYLEKILNSPKALSKMYVYQTVQSFMGHGLFSAPVLTWKRHRKILNPTFNQRVLNGFVEIFDRRSNEMGKYLEKFVGKGEFDLFETVANCMLDLICETAMGIKIEAQKNNNQFGRWGDRLLEIAFLRMYVPWYHLNFLYKHTKLYQEEKLLLEKYHGFTEKVIENRRSEFDKNPYGDSTKIKVFLDLLLELSTADNKLTDTELKDEVNTFMITGSDTTSTTSCFVFLMLGMHPQIQEKLYQEVIEVLGSHRNVEPEDLSILEYTERVIKETLRLFPVGGFIGRKLQDDLPISEDITLPKDSNVIISFNSVHRNSKIWPDPLTFNPDRFLPHEICKNHPYSYLPFSLGSRNCIGMKYAIMAVKTIIANTIRKYKFSTSYPDVESIKLKMYIVQRPEDGFKVTLQLRE